ncbi:hypothetical protein ACMFMF_002930 [Clarireedia jacksonii]
MCVLLWGMSKGHKCGNGARDARRRKRAEDILVEKEKNRPKNLPPTRRELSIGPGGRRSRIKLWTSKSMGRGKVSSALLRLPAELRRQILLEVLGESVIHLVQCRGRLGHIRCKEDNMQSFPHNINGHSYDIERRCIPPCQFSCRHSARFHSPYILESVTCTTLHPPRSESCLGVLRTCQQLYSEGIDLLYSTNVFDANDAETVLFLAQTIRPQRLKAIKHLQILANDPWPYADIAELHFSQFTPVNDAPLWVECCKLIGSQMTGLQSLTVRIGVYNLRDGYDPHTGERHLTQDRSLRQALYGTMLGAIRDSGIKGLKGFRLEIELEETQVIEGLQQGLRDIVCG